VDNFKSTDEVLDFALKNEEMSAELYGDLAKKMDNPQTRMLFEELEKEEIKHKEKVLEFKTQKKLEPSSEKVKTLKIADYTTEMKLTKDMSYQQALLFAMQAEKAEFRLYQDLAAATDDAGLRDTLLTLAQEEAKHKLRLEIEYDDYIMQEN